MLASVFFSVGKNQTALSLDYDSNRIKLKIYSGANIQKTSCHHMYKDPHQIRVILTKTHQRKNGKSF